MIRTLLTTITLLALASTSSAQGIRGKAPPPRIPPQQLQPPWYYNGYSLPYFNGYTTPYFSPFANQYYLPYGFGASYYPPVQTVPLQAPVTQSTSQKLPMPASPARFKLTFPVAAKVWLNGDEQDGSKREWTLSAPDETQPYDFDVRASWETDGQEYEWNRKVRLAKSETASATILRGHPVK